MAKKFVPPPDNGLEAEFNKRLGNRSRLAKSVKVSPSDKAKLRTPTSHAGAAGTRARVASGTSSVSAPTLKAHRKQFGDSHSVAEFQKTMNNVVEETMKTIQTKMSTERAVMAAIENPPEVEQSPGFLDRAIAAGRMIPGVGPLMGGAGNPTMELTEAMISAKEGADMGVTPWQGMMEDFSRSPASRALDIASRPFYALHSGLNTALQEDYRLRDEDQQQNNPLRFIDDFISGAGAGITGKEKTGPGDWWQTMRQGSDIAGFEQMREFQESEAGGNSILQQAADFANPFGELSGKDTMPWVDRAVGAVGEFTMDPAEWVGFGTTGILRNTGKQLSESAAKTAVRQSVDTVVQDFYDNTVAYMGRTGWRPTRDAVLHFANQAAEDSIENSLLEITAGAHGGWAKMGGIEFAHSAAQRVAIKLREEIFRPFNVRAERILDSIRTKTPLHINTWQTMMHMSPELKNAVEETWHTIENASNGTRQYTDVNDFIRNIQPSDLSTFESAFNSQRALLDGPLVENVASEILRNTRDLVYNTVHVRVGSRRIPIKTIGRVYSKLRTAAPENFKITVENFANNVSYERNFPGRMALIAQAGRSIGADTVEKYVKMLGKKAKDYADWEAELVYRHLENPGAYPLDARLQDLANWARKELDDDFALQIEMGARPDGTVHADDYVPIFTRKKSYEIRGKFKADRKKHIQDTGSAGRYNIEKAQGKTTTAGVKDPDLKPVTDIFQVLRLNKLKSSRDIARATFYKDLIENFGTSGKPLSSFAMERMGMTVASRKHLPQYMREIMDKKQIEFYLPAPHKQMFDKYVKLGKWDTELNTFLRGVQKLTNIVKYMSTVIRTGFHIRNMIGDFYMGLMDNVPIRAYMEVFQKYMRSLRGANVGFRISPNLTLSMDQARGLFDTRVNTGFVATEISPGGATPSSGQHIRNARTAVAGGIRKASDMREDYGRFVHFITALRQEAAGFAKRGVTDQATLINKATEAAAWRVNHYKFDYNALTGMERSVKLAFPFYTFTRKVLPTLVQQLALNPRYLTLPNRFMEKNSGNAADALFNHHFIPDYVKDLGYGILNNEEEPLFITQDILPTAALNTFDFTNAQEFGQSVARQANPLAQIPFEVALDKKIFDQTNAGSFPEYMYNKFSVPGQVVKNVDPGRSNDPLWQQILNEGFFGAGIPVRTFTEEQQDFGMREAEDRFIQDPFQEFNRSQDRFRIYQSNRQDGTSFRLENVHTGEVVAEAQNPAQLLERAKRMTGG